MAGFFADAQIPEYSIKKSLWQLIGVLYLLWGLYTGPVMAQATKSGTKDKKAADLFNRAIESLSRHEPLQTIALLHQAIKRDTGFIEAYLKLGQAYEFIRQPDQAFQVYQHAIDQHPDQPLVGLAYQFVSTHLLDKGQYEPALRYLERFQRFFASQSPQGKRIERLVQTARFGQQAMQNPLPVKPYPFPIIQAFPSQYFPVLTADEQTIVFTALKQEGDEDLMTATYKGQTWSTPESLSSFINTPNNEGTPTLSADGRTLVFTACQGRTGFGGCDLYISRKVGFSWSTPQNMGPAINTSDWESQPALSADGRRLYFVSDRKGGVGRRDIWCSELGDDGTWKPPYNLKTINSLFDEASPFIHANGHSLFFASKGHIGMGGYDLFVADSTTDGWSNPKNLGYPINTADDQVALFVSANGTRAYYSYEEVRTGKEQRLRLFMFDLPESLRQKIRPASYLKGIVTDAQTQQPLAATIELIDLSTNRLVTRINSDSLTGQYIVVLPTGSEYALYVTRSGYLFKSLSFDFTQKMEGESLSLCVLMEPINSAGKEMLNNIFFESGRFDLARKSKVELDRLAMFMEKNPTVKVEIAGHTDDQGDASANLVLSKKRAQSVKEYLMKVGVSAKRIQSTGYGETRPLVSNTNDETRRQNRRIEWRIL